MMVHNNNSWIFWIVLLAFVAVLVLGILIERQVMQPTTTSNSAPETTLTPRPPTTTAPRPSPTAPTSNVATMAAIAVNIKATERSHTAAISLTLAAAAPLISATATEVARQANVKATNDKLALIAMVAGLTQTPVAQATQQAIEQREIERQGQIIEGGVNVSFVVIAGIILALTVVMAYRFTMIERTRAVEAETRRVEAETRRLENTARLVEAEAQKLREIRRNAQVTMLHSATPATLADTMKPHLATDDGNGQEQTTRPTNR